MDDRASSGNRYISMRTWIFLTRHTIFFTCFFLLTYFLFLPEQGNAVIQRTNQDVRVTVVIHVHPSIDGVAKSSESIFIH